MLSNRLEGKVCVVTGIAAGIGQGVGLMLARHGAKVIGCDIDAAGAEKTLATAAAEGLDLKSLHPVDLTHPDGATRLMDFAIATHGRIDALVNAAAVGIFKTIEEMDYEKDWRRTLTGELDIVFLGCKAAWPHLKKNGGAIVNFASVNAYEALRGSPALAHCAGKGGVLAMSRQLALEGGPHRIRVNTVSPGFIETAATREALAARPNMINEVKQKLIADRIGQPEDIAWCITYLVSDEAVWVTGADFHIDGGATAI